MSTHPIPEAPSGTTTFDLAETRALAAEVRDSIGRWRDRQPTIIGVQVVDALIAVAMQAAECGCECCSTNLASMIANVDLEDGR